MLAKGGLISDYHGVNTLYENFQRGLSVAGDKPCLGTRVKNADGSYGDFAWLTYKEVHARAQNVGSALIDLGLQTGDFVGLYSQNCADWVIVEQACNAFSLVTVPLYDTLGADAVEYIVNQSNLTTVFCSSENVEMLMSVAPRCPSLSTVVHFGSGGAAAAGAGAGEVKGEGAPAVALLDLASLEASGAASPKPAIPPRADALATICYTSGTTGNPKGAMLLHSNFAAAMASVMRGGVELVGSDVHISYLPLAHLFERLVQMCIFHAGARIGFFRGDVTLLMEDIAVLRPTVFPSVPRLFNRIYDKITQGVSLAGGVKKALFDYALASKQHYLGSPAADGSHTRHALWDALVFGKVKQALGGRVRLMVTGSAPISSEVKNFLQIAFSCPVVEGYGLTESCAAGTLTTPGMAGIGHVGVPAPSVEVKLVDVPDMNYTSADKPFPRGEICLRGPNVFVGYYKLDAKTRECIDADGWFHSGDIGRWNLDGTLSIIDRKKNIFKLAQGEYVAPEKIENVYARSKYVAQCFVYGDSLKPCLVSVVVVDPEVVESWAQAKGLPASPTGPAGLPDVSAVVAAAASNGLQQEVTASMDAMAKEAKLRGFERAKAVLLSAELFSVENGLLTPTFKLKRPQARTHFQGAINDMYTKLGV